MIKSEDLKDTRSNITDNCDHYLPEIKKLWRKHSDNLGFFPKGAFEDYCNKKQILVAHSANNELQGYLLFRNSKSGTTIVHLCVSPAFRSKGTARLLVERLKNISSDSKGIGLKCRRDYELSGFWSALGFIARDEAQGRGKDTALLTRWWMDFGHPDLFSFAAKDSLISKLCLVIDSNVFYGIYSSEKKDDEAKSLIADWLPDNIELCVTDEIFNEIDRRNTNTKERSEKRRLAESFTILPCSSEKATAVENELIKLMPPKTESDRSDIRHLARAIGSNALYFITRDRGILKHSEALYERFQISVLRPYDIIIKLDQVEKGHEYQPARLSGTQYKLRLVKVDELDAIAQQFVCRTKNERTRDFRKLIAEELADQNPSSCYVLESPAGDKQCLFLIKTMDEEIVIPVFRISRSPLAATIGRHILRKFLNRASAEGKSFVTICDSYIDEGLLSILAEDGFFPSGRNWIKISLFGIINSDLLDSHLSEMVIQFPKKKSIISKIKEDATSTLVSQKDSSIILLEKIFWPLKIIGRKIQCFIVPIKPVWAQQLFDEHLARQDLFGSNELMFNAELVYYRAKKPGGLVSPARILWYVSHEKSRPETGAIRAVSILDEVNIGSPKQLFSKYRRFGIYKWHDLVKTAKNHELMALKFSNTYLVDKPLKWAELRAMLHKFGKSTTLQSPFRISEEIFTVIFRKMIAHGRAN